MTRKVVRQDLFYDDGDSTTLLERPKDVGVLPSGRKFGRLRHDYEVYGVSRPTRNGAGNNVLGLPETVKVVEPVFQSMSKEWQFFNLDILSIARYGRLYSQLDLLRKEVMRNVFRGTFIGYRAVTNSHGSNNGFYDYVNKVGGDRGPIEQETINTGGNIVEILGEEIKAGKKAYKVRILDGTKPPPDPLLVNHITTPWLIVKLTNSQRVKVIEGGTWNGKWIEDVVEPFPQNDGKHNPVGFMGKGSTNWITASRVEVLKPNAYIPSPYNKYK